MTQKTKKFLCAFLTLIMLIPLCSAFAISVGAATVDNYTSAKNGDLLYTANFNGDTVWSPKKRTGWGAMTVTPIDSGNGAKFYTTAAYKNSWGAELKGYPVCGNSYTIVFTATGLADEGQHIGISVHGSSYVLVTPGRDRFALAHGDYKTANIKKSFGGYSYSQSCGKGISRTYALEFAASSEGATTKYNLYVQDGGAWKLIYKMTNFSNFSWDPGENVSLWFVKYLSGENGDQNVDDYNQKQTDSASVSNVKLYKGNLIGWHQFATVSGAEVRLSDPTGIRFTGLIGKDYLDGLKTTYGDANVKVGMVITPTDYLADNSLAFTMEALDGCAAIEAGKKYVKIEAATILDSEDGNAYLINCALTNILEDNYAREFSAITYIEINNAGDITYKYSPYYAETHSRSVAYVASLALSDTSNINEPGYTNFVAGEGRYSPYTTSERTTLSGFCNGYAYTVMSYNIEQYESTDGWEGRNPAKVVETINNTSADIVGLQEVNGGWATSLAALNGYTCVQGDTTANAWDNLYYKTALFNCTESGTKNYRALADVYTSVSKNNADIDANDADMTRDNSKRMFTYAFLTDKNTGNKILAINTHLHYRNGSSDTAATAENSQVRSYEFRLLDAWIKAQDSSKFDMVVIVGDMNEHYKSGTGKAVIDEFKGLGYDSAIETAKMKNGNIGNTLAVTERTALGSYVFDYIFTQGDVENVMFTVIDNKIDNDNTSYPSDHLPVLARIYMN